MQSKEEMLAWLKSVQIQMDLAINNTPTGVCRIALCDVNIFLRRAVETFEGKSVYELEGGT